LQQLAERPWLRIKLDGRYAIPPPDKKPLYSLLVDSAKAHPDKTCIHFEGRNLSYSEVDDISSRFASALVSLGLKKGDRVAVFMPNQVHVVCYVAEVSGYLDFNRRREPSPLAKCDGALSAIGASVARSFQSDWSSASEYTFQKGAANFVLTAFH